MIVLRSERPTAKFALFVTFTVVAVVTWTTAFHPVEAFHQSPMVGVVVHVQPIRGVGAGRVTVRANRVVVPFGRSSSFERTVRRHVPFEFSLGSSSSSSGSSSTSSSSLKETVVSTGVLVFLDVALRRSMAAAKLSFPSSLAGCGLLLLALLGTTSSTSDGTVSSSSSSALYPWVGPGSVLLAKWLPVFFVPSLVTLPLTLVSGEGAPKGTTALAKVAVVLVGGYLVSLLSTAGAVLGVRTLLGASSATAPTTTTTTTTTTTITTKQPSPPAFSATTLRRLVLTAVAGLGSAITLRRVVGTSSLSSSSSSWVSRLETVGMASTTLAGFVWGSRFSAAVRAVIHPLLTCTTVSWIGAAVLAGTCGYGGSLCDGGGFLTVLRRYKAGAGAALLFPLGPAVVALACQIYQRRRLVRTNAAEVSAAVLTGSTLGGFLGTAVAVQWLGLASGSGSGSGTSSASSLVALSLLSRNITSPLAMAMARLLGVHDPSLAVAAVVLSGLLGASTGPALLTACGVTDPVARGLSVGVASHGLGTAAMAAADETEAFPFAAIAMALTASLSTVLLSIPSLRRATIAWALAS